MRNKLFPKIKPYRHGYFNAGDGHKLYYELCGNPKGKPLLYVHGGPGAGCSESSRRYFNPKKWNIILFDQRGAGRSRPFASTQANTTWNLVADMRRLLRLLGIKKVFLFGGSWGSTLSLVYAIKHPETVSGMLLRGIFLARNRDIIYAFGGGAEKYFPEAWERFIRLVPEKHRKGRNAISYYAKKMKSKNAFAAKKFAYEWARYELSMLKLEMPTKEIRKSLKEYNYLSLGKLEAHYTANKCFLPENYILRNAYKIRNIQATIVQGRYDTICPPIQAWLLHKALPKSKLFILTAGHASSEPEIQGRLVNEMERMR